MFHQAYLTVLCHNTEVFSINEAVVKFDDAWMVQIAQQIGLVHGVQGLIWLQVSHWDLLQNFAAAK